MTDFTHSDIESLEAKLLDLELSPREQAALTGLIGLAEHASSEVSGFGGLAGLQPGRLSFLGAMASVDPGVRPHDDSFASAGGLGSTRVTDGYLGGSLGDETAAHK